MEKKITKPEKRITLRESEVDEVRKATILNDKTFQKGLRNVPDLKYNVQEQ